MWSYIIRRLLVMIPTLFGVTVVSFCIMQLAPGDPLQSTLGAAGTAGQSSQTREAYLIQKRELRLDRPLVLNFNYFRDFTQPVRIAAYYRGREAAEIAADLERLATQSLDAEGGARLAFLRSLRIPGFDDRLTPHPITDAQLSAGNQTREQWNEEVRQRRMQLAESVKGYLLPWCEDTGMHGIEPAVSLLMDSHSSMPTKIGAVRCLASMIPSPFQYTFSRQPNPADDRAVVNTWKLVWEQEAKKYPPVDPDRAQALRAELKTLAGLSRSEMFDRIQGKNPPPDAAVLTVDDVPFFVETILSDVPREEKVVAAEFVKLSVAARVQLDVAPGAAPDQVNAVAHNWIAYYEVSRGEFVHSLPTKLVYLFTDTQYAHMVWRLVTFQFGQSTLKTREPVWDRLGNALIVSAPLMLLAELVIYLVAVPLGVLCAVYRGQWIDRLVSLQLFLLYSVPPFVAGMLMLLFLCYGSYLKIFPMERLHSPGAEHYGFIRYVLDYLWHATLPVICLSLFSLAGMAMYGRSAMLDVLGQDYVRTARAKGLTASTVVRRHALRNALLPFITLFASFLPAMLGGSVLIEYLFNIPGMGYLSFEIVRDKDIPTLMALTYLEAIVVMLSILACDLLYVVADPRISLEGQGSRA